MVGDALPVRQRGCDDVCLLIEIDFGDIIWRNFPGLRLVGFDYFNG